MPAGPSTPVAQCGVEVPRVAEVGLKPRRSMNHPAGRRGARATPSPSCKDGHAASGTLGPGRAALADARRREG